MKQCPTCNRTYPDDTQSFCLDDGTPLTAPYDPEATHVISATRRDSSPAVSSSPGGTAFPPPPARQGSNPALYVVVALLALFVGGGLVALLRSETKDAQVLAPPTPKPTVTPNASSSSPKQPLTSRPEKREWTVTVLGTDKWRDTGITMEPGERLTFETSGLVNTAGGPPNTDPNGYAPDVCDKPDCIAQGVPYGALVGKIGSSNPFRIGTSLELTTTSGGRLHLAVNDNYGHLSDNNGSFTAHITKR